MQGLAWLQEPTVVNGTCPGWKVGSRHVQVAAWRDQEKMDNIGPPGLVSGLHSEQLALDLGKP